MKPIEPGQFPWKDFRRYTYPLGLDLGACAFLSGMTASVFDATLGKVVAKGTIREQASLVTDKIGSVLRSAGYGFDDVVSIVQYVPAAALDSLDAIDDVLRGCGLAHASRHVVPVARLLRRDALLEIEVVAARRADRSRDLVRVLSKDGECIVACAGQAFGSIEAQVEAFDIALAATGSGWRDVARCRAFVPIRDASELEDSAAAIRARVPVLPIVPLVGVPALPPGYQDAQLTIEWVAPNDASSPAQSPRSDPSCDASLQAVSSGLVRRVGPFLVATGLQADVPGNGIEAQARRLYGQIVPALLARYGVEMKHLVQTVEWLTQDALPDYRQTAEIRRGLLCEPFPVASGLVCSALPADARLAVDLVALVQPRALAVDAKIDS